MMRKDIHPKWYPNAKVICNGEVVMEVGSTSPELRVDVWSGNHPFYTGEQRIIDSGGQVERFMNRLSSYSKAKEDATKRQTKAIQKAEQRFAKQQLAALDLNDRVSQILLDNNIVTVGDLSTRLDKNIKSLLAIEGLTQPDLDNAKTVLEKAKANFLARV
ncbi:MAG: 50S ribosomal protein L31 [Anaerolineae bacterium]|nr:50S ribosomal protein L31 [Anaerolineae bacterium]